MNITVLRTILFLLFAAVVAYPSGPGSLDLSFAGSGYKLDGFGMGYDHGRATAIQPDGKILVAGYSGIGNLNVNVALARYNADGTLDTTFNGEGKVVASAVSGDDQGLAVAIQPDGRIVVAGFANDGTDKFLIVRFNSDGTLDLSFDGDGKVITSITGVADRARDVAIQADGKIVAAGFAANNWAVVRYNTNGSLDPTFDGDGIVTTSINSSGGLANAVAIQPDGKIVTAGGCAGDFAVVRYNSDGSLDTTFDGDGAVTTPVLGANDIAYSVALEPDGQIVAAGGAVFSNFQFDFAIVRYNADGSLDTGFSADGKLTAAFPGGDETALSVAIQPDGKIVAAGYTQGGGNSGDFALLRCDADGSLDTTFDGDGQLTSHISDQFDGASSVAIGADGKILAVGHTQHVNDDFALIRYNSDGSPDTGFDADGVLISDIGNGGSRGRDVVVQPDGKIITAGTSVSDLALVRNNPDGSLDISFGTGGKVKTSFEFFSSNPADMVLQPDGKILIVGFTDIGPSLTRIALVRLNPDGSLDPSFDGDGKVTTSIFGGAGCAATSVAIAPDGKIVITGWGINSKITAIQYVLIRYNTNGSLDNTFDSDGIAVQPSTFSGTSVMVQADGKPVMSGIGSNTFAVARYNQNGTIDTSFDGDGIAVTPMSPGGASAAYSLSLLADGRIVAGGETSDGTNLDFAVARYISNGSLDASFDGDGKAITPVLAGDDHLGRIAVQSDGKIVAAGYVQNGPNLDMALVRYNTDGSLDSSYGLLGKAITDLGIYDYADGLTLDAADRALVVTPGAGGGFTTARFTSDFAPLVDVGGRITSTNGQGISGATVVLTDANNVSQTARTNAFGYYSFSGVSSNEIYAVRVSSKRYRFQPSSQTITVTGSLANVDFVGNPGSESKNAVAVEEKITVEVKETGRKKPG